MVTGLAKHQGLLSRRAFAAGGLALAAASLSGCGYLFRGAGWRQKLTLSAYTPDGEVTASTVTAVRVPPSNVRGQTEIIGEALYADLGAGRTLFALLDANMLFLVPRVFLGFKGGNRDDMPTSLDYGSLEGLDEVRSVPFEICPQLVTFISPQKPMSIRNVNPEGLDSFFGVGFGIKSITVEVTEDPLTEGRINGVLSDDFFAEWETLRNMNDGAKKKADYMKSQLSALAPSDFRRQASS